MLSIRAVIHKMFVRIGNREDPDQSQRTSLICICTVCLRLSVQILEVTISFFTSIFFPNCLINFSSINAGKPSAPNAGKPSAPNAGKPSAPINVYRAGV